MRKILSLYSYQYPKVLVYMLQATEYKAPDYLKWLARVKNFNKVIYRRSLDKTKVAHMLLVAVRVGMIAQVLIGLAFLFRGLSTPNDVSVVVGVALIVLYPIVWAYLIVVPLQIGRWLIINPRWRKQIKAAEKIYSKHKGIKIAVAGSYGKTTMKELLLTVLSEGKKTIATPANKNVAISHARFAQKFSGDEEVLIIEYGEEEPGDIADFIKNTHPDKGVITGLAPAHLNSYPSLEAAGEDIFTLAKHLNHDNIYVNNDSEAARDFIDENVVTYDSKKVGPWKISNIKVDINGTSFEMAKGKTTLKLKSGLLGKHQVGPLSAVVALAHELGLNDKQIEAGVAKTKPFDNRMKPRKQNGAIIIDDTYNGNIDGMKAGLKLIKELSSKRKIYVTPGLVDQGVETESVHLELGQAIADAKPDRVVLMYNSVTRYIQNGLEIGSFKGKLQIEHYPLDFYINLEHIVAAGDLVLLQNDWTDNYA